METLYSCLSLIIVVLVIIFQPEIRRFFKSAGRFRMKPSGFLHTNNGTEDLTEYIVQIELAVEELARSKFGALIVLEAPETKHDYLSPGTQINADISSNLIVTIFNPKSPLHDGAIVIQKNKIKGAGVILPITLNHKLSHIYGTRHRAALGLSEICPCLCIVVSEETGSISIAFEGKLSSCTTIDELRTLLMRFYSYSQINTQKINSIRLAKFATENKSSQNKLKSQPDSDGLAQAADA